MQPEYLSIEELVNIILNERLHRDVRSKALSELRRRDHDRGYREAMWGEDDE